MSIFVGWQGDTPVFARDTRENLESIPAVSFDRITEEPFAEAWCGTVYLEPEKLEKAQSIPIRAERDRRLAETDYLMMPDYPLSDADRERMKTYRQQLRDLPADPAFPWGGAVDDVPWPKLAKPAAQKAVV